MPLSTLAYASYPASDYGYGNGLVFHSPSSTPMSRMASGECLQFSPTTAALQAWTVPVPVASSSPLQIPNLQKSRKRTLEEDPSDQEKSYRPFSTVRGESWWNGGSLAPQPPSSYASTLKSSPTVPAGYSQMGTASLSTVLQHADLVSSPLIAHQAHRSMPPPSHPASSLVTQQSFASPPPTRFAYKRPTIRYGALTNSGLDEDSCEPWLSIAFPSKERRQLELCSERVYDMKRWQAIWTTKLILMQNLKDDSAVPCPDDMFREPPPEQDGYTTYRRIWLFADCFLGWQEGQFGLWLFFLDEGTWELQRVMPMSLPLDNDRASALLQEMKSTMLGFAMSDRGKAKVEESWNGLQFGGASSVSFSQASLS